MDKELQRIVDNWDQDKSRNEFDFSSGSEADDVPVEEIKHTESSEDEMLSSSSKKLRNDGHICNSKSDVPVTCNSKAEVLIVCKLKTVVPIPRILKADVHITRNERAQLNEVPNSNISASDPGPSNLMLMKVRISPINANLQVPIVANLPIVANPPIVTNRPLNSNTSVAPKLKLYPKLQWKERNLVQNENVIQFEPSVIDHPKSDSSNTLFKENVLNK